MEPSALESVSRSLESCLDWWGVFILASTAIVAIGLVVEYWEPVHEFIEEWRRPAAAFPWRKFWGLTGGILVTVGVLGEFWGAYKASRVETQLRVNNHKIEKVLRDKGDKTELEAAKLGRDAEGLKKEAEDERLARTDLQKQIQPRTLSLPERKTLADKLRQFAPKFKGRKVKLESQVGDAEGVVFAVEIYDILHRAGIDVDPSGVAREQWVGTVYFGAKITGPSNDAGFIESLTCGLRNGIGSDGVDAEARQKYRETVVTVGVKPILGLPKQWLRKTPP